MSQLRAAIICHDDSVYLEATIKALADIPATVFVNEITWSEAEPGDWQATVSRAKKAGATVVCGKWPDEATHREATLAWAREQGVQHLLIPDSDEIIGPELLCTLKKLASIALADVVHCTMDTYWKSPEYVIRPRERLMPAIMIQPGNVTHVKIREFRGARPLLLSEEHGLLHHLSYAGPGDRILRKIQTWSHRDELQNHWWRDKWLEWDKNRFLRDFHPTHPPCYRHAERIHVPEVLRPAWEAYLEASGGGDPLRHPELEPLKAWPKISVIIPLYGGEEDIRACLTSLGRFNELLHEVLVIDDASPDDAAAVVGEFPFASLTSNEKNMGFARTCNRGASLSTGEVLLFLNSDAIVPKAGLLRLIESLMKSGTVGAAGPVSNCVGHFQAIPVTFESLETMPLFAEDLAHSARTDEDHDMLVGFCLAIRRTVWDEVGAFDEQYLVGMFEDNDLCYRLRRAGYRLVISHRAFVYHQGNASLDRHPGDKIAIFYDNSGVFWNRWKSDVEFGFSSHLSGFNPARIHFNESRRPEHVRSEVEQLAARANISLCMIVRDEERVLAQCLESAKPFFTQIVVVDTGSTDRTIEIAESFGAEVHEVVWPDSFAEARNESLKYATGDWICWLDADDTLPFLSGETMVNAVLNAPERLGGLIMPVRFVNDDPEYGTSVDHVKVFRNGKGFKFEHRIHEQILPAIRSQGFDVARLMADVLHTGYDTSEEGQEKKRLRDDRLLKMDLEDHPNHPFVLFNLGMTAHYNKVHEEAVEWLQKSITASSEGESHVRKAYALWAVSMRELGDFEGAFVIVKKGLDAIPDDAELLFNLGSLSSHFGRHDEAVWAYERLLEVGRGMHFSSVDSGIFGFKSWFNLAGAYANLGDYQRAKVNYMRAINANPRYNESLHALFGLACSRGDWETSEYCIAALRGRVGEASDEFQNMAQHYSRVRTH